MLDKLPTVSGAGDLTFCKAGEKSLEVGLAKKSSSPSSYKEDILGGVLAQLILRAITGGTACSNYVAKVNYDNTGISCHGRGRWVKAKENWSKHM